MRTQKPVGTFFFIFMGHIQNMKKEKALETINSFPMEFDLNDLIERLIFVEKVEKGLLDLDNGKTIPHTDIKNSIGEWEK